MKVLVTLTLALVLVLVHDGAAQGRRKRPPPHCIIKRMESCVCSDQSDCTATLTQIAACFGLDEAPSGDEPDCGVGIFRGPPPESSSGSRPPSREEVEQCLAQIGDNVLECHESTKPTKSLG